MGTGDVGLRLLQKKLVFIKLMEETKTQSMEEDPFLGMFAEGMDEFARYQCHKAEGKSQRHREKIQRYERDANDRELKKQRNKVRRDAEKQRVKLSFGTKTPEEIKSIKDARHVIWRQEREKVTAAMKTGQVVMIDLVFEDKMNGKENKSLGKQVELITKAIKHIDHPPSVHLCSFGGQAEVILNRMGVPHWSVTSHTEDILEVGKILNKKLVYLSPDAEDCLESVEHDTAYILGGLIDRSIIKNASLSRARDLGIEARKLPIRQFMKNRGVLNIDHVVMMILKFQECNDWKTAFTHACPKRWKIDDEEPQKEASMDKDKEASINQDEQKPQPPSQTQTQSEQKTETC